jgi:hypothetical protein
VWDPARFRTVKAESGLNVIKFCDQHIFYCISFVKIKLNLHIKSVHLFLNTVLKNADIIKVNLLHSFLKLVTHVDPEECGGFKKSFWIGK